MLVIIPNKVQIWESKTFDNNYLGSTNKILEIKFTKKREMFYFLGIKYFLRSKCLLLSILVWSCAVLRFNSCAIVTVLVIYAVQFFCSKYVHTDLFSLLSKGTFADCCCIILQHYW